MVKEIDLNLYDMQIIQMAVTGMVEDLEGAATLPEFKTLNDQSVEEHTVLLETALLTLGKIDKSLGNSIPRHQEVDPKEFLK